jgi:hypothetical protein
VGLLGAGAGAGAADTLAVLLPLALLLSLLAPAAFTSVPCPFTPGRMVTAMPVWLLASSV